MRNTKPVEHEELILDGTLLTWEPEGRRYLRAAFDSGDGEKLRDALREFIAIYGLPDVAREMLEEWERRFNS